MDWEKQITLNGPRVFIALRHKGNDFQNRHDLTLSSCLEKCQILNLPTEDVLHDHHQMYCMTDAAEL